MEGAKQNHQAGPSDKDQGGMLDQSLRQRIESDRSNSLKQGGPRSLCLNTHKLRPHIRRIEKGSGNKISFVVLGFLAAYFMHPVTWCPVCPSFSCLWSMKKVKATFHPFHSDYRTMTLGCTVFSSFTFHF